MAVSAINFKTFEYKPAFGNENQENSNEQNVNQFTRYRFHSPNITSKELKEPVVVAGTVAGAGVLSYLSAQCILAGVLARFAPKLSVSFETGLRNKANKIKETAKKWADIKPDGNLSKLKQLFGKGLQKLENTSRNIYKSVAYIGLPDTMSQSERTYNSFGNIAGTVTAIGTMYNLCTKDEDGDGIKDIMQRKK